MSNIIPFSNSDFSVRAVQIDGEAWFVGKDAASQLGYANESDAMSRHCRGVVKHYPIADSLGRMQDTRIINEPDLYRLIVGSTLPAAEKFERWVFEEVLPAIRKTGAYSAPSKPAPGLLPGPAREFRAAHGIAKLIGLKGNQAALAANKATLRITGLNMLQTLDAEKLIADDTDPHMTVTEIGSRFGMTAAAVNELLIEEGYQTRHSAKVKGRVRHRYTPTDKGKRYAVLVDMDKAHVAGKPIQNLEWKASIMPHLALAMKKEVV